MKKQLLSYTLALCMMITMLPVSALAAQAEPESETSAACTLDETCEAETHLDGCPFFAVPPETDLVETDTPEACTQDENCTADTHLEGCPQLESELDETDDEETRFEFLDEDVRGTDAGVTPEASDLIITNGVCKGLSNAYYSTLTDEQKQNVHLVIPESVTEISDHAFSASTGLGNRVKLVTLQFPENCKVTKIGTQAFYQQSSLTGDLILPDSIETINNNAFGGCGFNGTLKLPDNEKYTKVNDQLFDQTKITSLEGIPSNIISLGKKAFGATNLSGDIVIPDTVTSLDSAFSGTKIETLIVPSSITYISPYFISDCLQLKWVKLNFDFDENITRPSGQFMGSGSYADELNVIVKDRTSYNYIYPLTFSSCKKRLTYPLTVSLEGYDASYSRQVLYNRPLNWKPDDNGLTYSVDETFKLPEIPNAPEGYVGKWRFSASDTNGITETSTVTGDKISPAFTLAPPTITYSDGIDKVYDGTPSIVSVNLEHPLYSPRSSAKNGDVVIRYDWGWATIGTTWDNPNSGWDKNTYDVGGVRFPTVDVIACRVMIRAFTVRDGKVTNADEFFRMTYDFPVKMRKGTPVVTPQYSQDPIPLNGSLPEITAESNVPGTISWDADQTLVPGSAIYNWTFTPEDNGDDSEGSANPIKNYEIVTGSAPLLVYDPEKVPEAPTTGDIVESILPELPENQEPTPEQQQDILGAKQLAESAADTDAIPEETRDALNEALAKLPQVDVHTDVKVENQAVLLENMTGEHAQALINAPDNTNAKYEIVLSAQEKNPTAEEVAAMEAVLNGATLSDGQQLTVKETLTIGETTTERELSELRRPVTLVFDVPAALAGSSAKNRTFYVVRVHTDETGAARAETLRDEDGNPETVTVLSDKFSYYALAYKDTGSNPKPSSGSHSTGTSRYTVSVDAGKHGDVLVSPKTAAKGATVTITVQPDEGYALDTLAVTDEKDNTIQLKEQERGTYTFVMPAAKVTVEAAFKELAETETSKSLPFEDIPTDAWYADAVRHVFDKGLMTGTDSTHFQPNAVITRGMIVAMLWRMEDQPEASRVAAFSDVAESAYYADAVAWADEIGLVKGYANGTFGASDPITREQLAAILYRYAVYKGIDVSNACELSEFADASITSGYARTALCWAVDRKLISGTGENTLTPTGHATRAHAAAIIMRFKNSL